MGLERGWEDVNCVRLFRERHKCQALVNTVMTMEFRNMGEIPSHAKHFRHFKDSVPLRYICPGVTRHHIGGENQ
jgi:hypothetical protein